MSGPSQNFNFASHPNNQWYQHNSGSTQQGGRGFSGQQPRGFAPAPFAPGPNAQASRPMQAYGHAYPQQAAALPPQYPFYAAAPNPYAANNVAAPGFAAPRPAHGYAAQGSAQRFARGPTYATNAPAYSPNMAPFAPNARAFTPGARAFTPNAPVFAPAVHPTLAMRPAAATNPASIPQHRDGRLTQAVARWRSMANDGIVRGGLDLDAVWQVGPNAFMQAIKQAAPQPGGAGAASWACLVGNAYADVLAYKRRNTGTNQRAQRQNTALDALVKQLGDSLQEAVTSLPPQNTLPGGRDVTARTLRLLSDAPGTLAHWLHAAGGAALSVTSTVDGGTHLRISLSGANLLLPIDRGSAAPFHEDADVGRLVGLIDISAQQADAPNIARWLCEHARYNYGRDAQSARETLRTAFAMCPAFDPGELQENGAADPALTAFTADVWAACEASLRTLADAQTPQGPWADGVQSRDAFWEMALALCDRADVAWQNITAAFIERVPMYPDAIAAPERERMAELLTKLPAGVASEAHVAALASWYADAASSRTGRENLVNAAKVFLQRLAADATQSRRAPFYGVLAHHAQDHASPASMQALLDVLPGSDPLHGMELPLAADLLMNVEEKYLRAHPEKFESMLRLLSTGDCSGLGLCDGDRVSRWRAIVSIESLQPLSAIVLQNEYAQMRPAPSVASLLQQAMAAGCDLEVTHRLEDVVSKLPEDASLYVRLNMALAERGRLAGSATSSAKKGKLRGRAVAPVRPKQSRSLEKSLGRLATVFSRAQAAAVSASTEPRFLDFLRQEMRAFNDKDLSPARDIGDKVPSPMLRQWAEMLSRNLDETFHELLTLTEIIYRREDFDGARPLMQALLQHVSNDDTQLSPQQKASVETTLRAWTADAPDGLQQLARTFGAMDFAHNLRALHTRPRAPSPRARNGKRPCVTALRLWIRSPRR